MAAAFFAGAFLAALVFAAAFFAGVRVTLVADAFTTTPAAGTRAASDSVSASNRSSSSSKRSDMIADLLRDLALHVGGDALGRLATAIDELLHDSFRIASLDLALVDQLFDEGIGPFAGDLGELDAGVDQLLDGWNLHRRMLVVAAKHGARHGLQVGDVESVGRQALDLGPRERRATAHQGEAAAQLDREAAVGVHPVADHHHRRGVVRRGGSAEQRGDQRCHRPVRLARDDRFDQPCRRDRGEDRSAARIEPVRRRVGGVGVRTDQPRADVDCSRSTAQPGVVEVAVQAGDDGVERRRPRSSTASSVPSFTTTSTPRACNASTTPGPPATSTRSPGSTSSAAAIAEDTTDPVASMPIAASAASWVGDRGGRIVGDEQHPPAGRLECGDRLGRAGDRAMGQPHDAVEVAQDGGDHRHVIVAVRGARDGIVGPCPGSPRSPPSATGIGTSTISSHRPTTCCPTPTSTNSGHGASTTSPTSTFPGNPTGPTATSGPPTRCATWIDDAVLVADDSPTFTIYRMRFTDATGTDRDIVGVLGGLEVVDEGAGGVLPHERVTPKASTDRLDLTRSTGANLSPVWGLSLAAGLTELLAEPAEPIASVTVDGVEHIVERVTDPDRIRAIGALLAADDVLIADGHHRYGISRTYRDERREATGADGRAPPRRRSRSSANSSPIS